MLKSPFLSFLYPVFGLVLLLSACQADKPLRPADPQLISGHTSGMISKDGVIKVVFTQEMVTSPQEAVQSPLIFEPALEGSAQWLDPVTLAFKPSKPLNPGQKYRGTLDFSKIKSDAKSGSFDFAFSVPKPSIQVTVDGLSAGRKTDGSEAYSVTGTVVTADKEDFTKVEKVLQGQQDGRGLKLEWAHEGDGRTHRFTLSDLQRQDKSSEVLVKWNGWELGAPEASEEKVLIPAKGSFEVVSIKPKQLGENFIEVRFSSSLKKNQDLSGLISVENKENLKYVVSDNLVKVYSPEPMTGSMNVKVETGIKSIENIPLQTVAASGIGFVNEKPQVRWANKGVIIPTSQGVTLPIETMNLRFVMVEVLQVFGNNMVQFLQVNDLNGGDELHRVGKVVHRKIIPTNFKDNQKDKWVLQGLDLNEITKKYPEGMFRVKVTFQRGHVVWNNMDNIQDEEEALPMDSSPQEASWWNYAEDWYGDDYGNSYNKRFDPTSPAYYKKYYDHDITIARNVMVSNIGLIAKKSTDGTFDVFASNLITAEPMAGAKLKVLDYTNQTLATFTTDKNGFAQFKPAETPSFIFAEMGGQFGYLKVSSGEALSISHFDAGGAKNEKGVNGFLYAERGVWRPGDTIFLTFILQDPNKTLPAGHPVKLEVFDPQSQSAYKKVLTKGLNGFYHFPIPTNEEGKTGDYLARVTVGGKSYEKTLKVETVKPNTLKINLDFSASGKVLSAGAINGTLQSERLTGAKVSGLRADITASFSPASTSFPKYVDYVFDDPSREFSLQKQTLWEGNLDENGVAKIQTSFNPSGSAPGMVKANLTTRVFESDTGDFSLEMSSIPFSPYNRYVGLQLPKGDALRGMLLTDVDHTARIALVDKDGNPLNGRVRAKIFQINWRWWWENGTDNEAEYVSERGYSPIKQDYVDIKNGYGEWKFQIKYPSWGRYMVQVEDADGGHRAGKAVYIDWPGWAGRAQKEGSAATMLVLSSDKLKYNTGETAVVTFPSNHMGKALVALESGGKILRSEWVNGAKDTTQYTFKVTDNMAPNIYVHVTYLQPHLQTLNDRPIRVYGLIPLMVESPQTRLNPVIQTADSVAPKSRMVIRVSEAQKRPMTYTLALVDEGLLGLTAYKTPNPWDHFFKREASLVQTFDLYDWVVNAYAGKLENQLAVGGDGEVLGDARKKQNRFEPVVRFLEPRTLAPGAVNTETIDLPNYIGAVRVMIVAAGENKSFGKAEKEVKVVSSLMVQPTLPRTLSPGEEIEVPVTVFNYDEAVKSVDVSIKVQGLASIAPAFQRVVFNQVGEKVISFKMKTLTGSGAVTVYVGASGNNAQNTPTGSRADAAPVNIAIRVPGLPVYTVKKYSLPPGAFKTEDVSMVGILGTNTATLEISNFPPFDLGKRLDYLIHYPYGCIEQTTSSVFPQLHLKNLMDVDTSRQKMIQDNVAAGIDRLKTFQTSRGGFAYWPGNPDDSTWGTNYAGHFLLEAKALGFAIPDGLLENWTEFQKNQANTWADKGEEDDLTQAYRLYTLALAGKPELGAMNRLMSSNLSSVAKWRLSAAYQLAGQKDAAQKLALSAALDPQKFLNLSTSTTFGSELRDKAMILEALSLMNFGDERTRKLAEEVSVSLSDDQAYHGTQTTAYALLALAKYRTSAPVTSPIKVKLEWGGKTEEITSTKPVLVKELNTQNMAMTTMTITNLGSAQVNPRIILKGIPSPDKVPGKADGMTLNVAYYQNGKGRVVDMGSSPIAQGSDWTIELEVTNNSGKDLNNVALNHLISGAFEIRNSRLSGEAAPKGIDYQDIRDDRVYTYFGLKKNETKRFEIAVNAAYKGRFYLPMVSVSPMYEPLIQGVVPGKWITIEQSGR